MAAAALVSVSMVSCDLFKLDNFDAPDGSLTGRIIDAETGENVQSDIIEGTMLRFIEHGYDNPQPQYMRVKCDGTYANLLMFQGEYEIVPDARNFMPIDPVTLQVGKNTVYDFEVIPYIRILDPSITKEGNNVKVKQISQEGVHDYTTHPAYQEVRRSMKPFWSDPYQYETDSTTLSLTTYSYPLTDNDNRFIAICGLDLSLEQIGDTLNARHIYPSSFNLLLTSGTVFPLPATQQSSPTCRVSSC